MNRAGVAFGDPESFSCPAAETVLSYGEVLTGDAISCTESSTDLTDWWTIEGLDD